MDCVSGVHARHEAGTLIVCTMHPVPLIVCTMHPQYCPVNPHHCTMHLSVRAPCTPHCVHYSCAPSPCALCTSHCVQYCTSNCVHLVLLMQPIVCTMHPSLCALWSPHCRLGTADRCRGPPGRRGWKGSMMDASLESLGGFSMVSDVTMTSQCTEYISHESPWSSQCLSCGARASDVLRGRPPFESCPNSLAEARSGLDLGRAPDPHPVCTTEAHACRTAAVGVPPHAACHQMW